LYSPSVILGDKKGSNDSQCTLLEHLSER